MDPLDPMEDQMRRAALALAAASAAFVTACGGDTATTATDPTAQPSSAAPSTAAPSTSAPESAAPGASSVPAAKSGYITFEEYQSDQAAYDGGDVVLFFNASWCPTCKRTVKNLEADPAAIPSDLTIVSVDYDSSGDLKQQYGVTYQHTFVQVDENGEQLAKWSGSETAEQIAGKTV
jgi:thioredoxin 1